MDTTLVIIPCYNEARFIGSVVILARKYAATVLVVDDGSSDETAEVAEKAGATVIRQTENRGKGAALTTGFKYALQQTRAAVIVIMDGDGQHNCAEIPRLVAPIQAGEAEVVVGSRFLGLKSKIPGWRVFGQRALTTVTNLSARAPVSDSQSGFRAFSRQALSQVNLDSPGFSVESEMQFIVHEKGLRLREVPISVVYVEPAKRNPVVQGIQVVAGLVRLVSAYHPLLFFGGGGLVILLAGLFWGLYVVDIYSRVRVLAVGYALISVLLTILGASSLFTGLMLYSVSGLLRDIKKSIDRLLRDS